MDEPLAGPSRADLMDGDRTRRPEMMRRATAKEVGEKGLNAEGLGSRGRSTSVCLPGPSALHAGETAARSSVSHSASSSEVRILEPVFPPIRSSVAHAPHSTRSQKSFLRRAKHLGESIYHRLVDITAPGPGRPTVDSDPDDYFAIPTPLRRLSSDSSTSYLSTAFLLHSDHVIPALPTPALSYSLSRPLRTWRSARLIGRLLPSEQTFFVIRRMAWTLGSLAALFVGSMAIALYLLRSMPMCVFLSEIGGADAQNPVETPPKVDHRFTGIIRRDTSVHGVE